jgi:TRAP-type transport system periplasmic protein
MRNLTHIMFNKKLPIILSCLLVAILFSCSGVIKDGPRLVKVGLTHNQAHSFTKALQLFAELVEERTENRYEIKIYHSSQLGGEQELQQMVTIGSVEMALSGVLNSYEPLFSVFEMPYLYRDREHVLKVNNSDIIMDVSASLHPKGLHLLGFYENGFRNITNSVRPINTPDDMRGLLIRTPENTAQIETIRALGAIPTPMSFSELYTALIQGVVDGQENPLQNIWNGRFYEAQRHLAVTHHIYNSVYIITGRNFWLSLPEEDRAIFKECLIESTLWQLDYMEHRDQELAILMQAEGMEFTYPDKDLFEQATLSAYEALYRQLGEKARDIVNQIKALH